MRIILFLRDLSASYPFCTGTEMSQDLNDGTQLLRDLNAITLMSRTQLYRTNNLHDSINGRECGQTGHLAKIMKYAHLPAT